MLQTNILQDSYLLELAEDWQTDHLLMVVDFVIKLQFRLLLRWNKGAAISSGFGFLLELLIFFALLGFFFYVLALLHIVLRECQPTCF